MQPCLGDQEESHTENTEQVLTLLLVEYLEKQHYHKELSGDTHRDPDTELCSQRVHGSLWSCWELPVSVLRSKTTWSDLLWSGGTSSTSARNWLFLKLKTGETIHYDVAFFFLIINFVHYREWHPGINCWFCREWQLVPNFPFSFLFLLHGCYSVNCIFLKVLPL